MSHAHAYRTHTLPHGHTPTGARASVCCSITHARARQRKRGNGDALPQCGNGEEAEQEDVEGALEKDAHTLQGTHSKGLPA